ncbi:MAG TPA: sulfite exporter TauE/SafE family protein [Longimicrobiales bacterium]
MFELALLLVAILAGAVAAIAGFGIGSLLTPVLATQVPLKLAVAAVSIPHLLATAIRFVMMRAHVDRKLLWTFGIFSALGGLTGALAHKWASSPVLTIIFGGALLLASLSELTGVARRVRLRGAAAWLAGALSGILGGMVGNQGGIRSAALLGFATTRVTFVATATAVALLVDGARMPVYLWLEGRELLSLVKPIAIACLGCVIGTFWGRKLLDRIPENVFRKLIASLILALGGYMLAAGLRTL